MWWRHGISCSLRCASWPLDDEKFVRISSMRRMKISISTPMTKQVVVARLPYIQFIKIVNLFGSERYFSLFFRAIVLVEARKMKWSLRRIYNKRFFRKSLKFFFFLFSSSFPSFLCLLKHISLVHKALRGNNVRIVPKKNLFSTIHS